MVVSTYLQQGGIFFSGIQEGRKEGHKPKSSVFKNMVILFLDCFSGAAPLNGEDFSTSLSPLLFLWQNTDGP